MNSADIAFQPATKVYRRFSFPGFDSQGTCYVKVHIGQRWITVLIAQLNRYTGTSVTDAYEAIVPSVAERIAKEFNVEHLRGPQSPWGHGAKRQVLSDDVVAMTKWTEYVPPGTSFHAEGTLAIMTLKPALEWHYCTRRAAQIHCDVPAPFFTLHAADLDFTLP